MHKKEGFTLVELLVVISIIALLMAILAPSLQRARKQAKAVVCMSNMHQWSLAWSMYAQENDGCYFGYDMFWGPLRPYYKNEEMLFCPMATRPRAMTWGEVRRPPSGNSMPASIWERRWMMRRLSSETRWDRLPSICLQDILA